MESNNVCLFLYGIIIVFILNLSSVSLVTGDISSSSLDDLASDIKVKVKNTNPADLLNAAFNHPEAVKWKERCIETVGNSAYKKIKRSGSKLFSCLTQEIRIKTLQKEVNASIEKGELDTVFKKYCGKRDKLLDCVDDMIDTLEVCADDRERIGLNYTRALIGAGIDFTCHDDGDRIAVFMSEDGIACVFNHSEEIFECIKEEVPHLDEFDEDNPLDTIDPEKFNIDDEMCDIISEVHRCIVKSTLKCSDPTPANVLDSLFIQMRKVTPCAYSSSEAITSVKANNAPSSFHLSHFLPHCLTILTAALMAAIIIL